MCRRWHHFNAHRRSHGSSGLRVELANLRIPFTDNEEGGSLHARQSVASQIWPTAPRDDQPDPFCRSAAVVNAAAAPVLAPNSAKGSWPVSLCWPSQSALRSTFPRAG